MYAIINSGGKQYRVGQGERVRVEKLGGAVGDEIAFEDVRLIGGEGKDPEVGSPRIDGARVVGKITRQGRNPKVLVFKFKRRKMYRRKRGHRQDFTEVLIDRIEAAGPREKVPAQAESRGEVKEKPKKKTPAAKTKAAKSPARKKAASSAATKPKKAAPKAEAKKKAPSKSSKTKTAAKPEKKAAKPKKSDKE